MGELVKRLRAAIVYIDCDDCMGDQLKTEAADRIEALEAKNARLKAALKPMIEELEAVQRQGCEICNGDCASATPPVPLCPMALRRDALSAARAAQEDKA